MGSPINVTQSTATLNFSASGCGRPAAPVFFTASRSGQYEGILDPYSLASCLISNTLGMYEAPTYLKPGGNFSILNTENTLKCFLCTEERGHVGRARRPPHSEPLRGRCVILHSPRAGHLHGEDVRLPRPRPQLHQGGNSIAGLENQAQYHLKNRPSIAFEDTYINFQNWTSLYCKNTY